MYEITANQMKEFILREISIFLLIINLICDFHSNYIYLVIYFLIYIYSMFKLGTLIL